MTLHLRLRNIGTLALHGRHPGEEWLIQADATGMAIDPLWRKRLLDEDRYRVGVVKIVGREEAGMASPAPTVSPTVPDIGPYLDLFGALADRVSALEQKPILDLKPAPVVRDQALIDRVASLEKLLTAALKS